MFVTHRAELGLSQFRVCDWRWSLVRDQTLGGGMKKIALLVGIVLMFGSQAFATSISYKVFLDQNEAVPTGSPGTGTAIITFDTTAHTMFIDVTFSGLLGTTTASHIHCCTPAADSGSAGVATTTPSFAGFPLGVTSGTFTNTLDMTLASSYNPAFCHGSGRDRKR